MSSTEAHDAEIILCALKKLRNRQLSIWVRDDHTAVITRNCLHASILNIKNVDDLMTSDELLALGYSLEKLEPPVKRSSNQVSAYCSLQPLSVLPSDNYNDDDLSIFASAFAGIVKHLQMRSNKSSVKKRRTSMSNNGAGAAPMEAENRELRERLDASASLEAENRELRERIQKMDSAAAALNYKRSKSDQMADDLRKQFEDKLRNSQDECRRLTEQLTRAKETTATLEALGASVQRQCRQYEIFVMQLVESANINPDGTVKLNRSEVSNTPRYISTNPIGMMESVQSRAMDLMLTTKSAEVNLVMVKRARRDCLKALQDLSAAISSNDLQKSNNIIDWLALKLKPQ